MKRSILILCVFILTGVLTHHPLFPNGPAPLTLTTAEQSNFTHTTLYKEVIEFLFVMQKK